MSFFEKEQTFLRDPKNIKIKDIVVFNSNYNEIKIEQAVKNYFSLLGEDPEKVILLVPVGWDGSTAGRPGARFTPKTIIPKFLNLNLNKNYKNAIIIMPYIKTIIGNKKKTFNNIRAAVDKILNLNQTKKIIPLFLGGDHSITQPILTQYIEKFNKINLIVFDSHFDLRTVKEGLSGGTYLRELKEQYQEKIDVVILGIKGLANPQYLYEQAAKFNVKYLTNIEIIDDFNKAKEFIKANLKAEIPTYISLDVDSIDLNYINSVNSVNSLGFNLREVISLISFIKINYDVVGIDIVEFNPLVGDMENSSQNLAELIYYL